MKCNSRHSHTPRDGRKYMAGGVHHNGHGQRQDQQIHPLVSTCHIPNGKFHRVDAGNHRTKQQKKAGGKKALFPDLNARHRETCDACPEQELSTPFLA